MVPEMRAAAFCFRVSPLARGFDVDVNESGRVRWDSSTGIGRIPLGVSEVEG